MSIDNDKRVTVEYTNYKGETRLREIRPERLWFGSTEYHPEKQWLLDVFDEEKQERRTYAMKDIHSWYDRSNKEER